MNYQLKLNKFQLKIFHESRKRRIYVGELIYNDKNDRYELLYNKEYARSKSAIPISPDLDLFKLHHQSEKGRIFPVFLDRIPEKSNPAYIDYCQAQGISINEKNPIILLGAIGRRGPSSFIFEPVYNNEFDFDEILRLRKQLQITQHDFSKAFGISKTTLQKIETGVSRDRNVLKYIQVLFTFPEVALWQLSQTGMEVHADVLSKLISYFRKAATTSP